MFFELFVYSEKYLTSQAGLEPTTFRSPAIRSRWSLFGAYSIQFMSLNIYSLVGHCRVLFLLTSKILYSTVESMSYKCQISLPSLYVSKYTSACLIIYLAANYTERISFTGFLSIEAIKMYLSPTYWMRCSHHMRASRTFCHHASVYIELLT